MLLWPLEGRLSISPRHRHFATVFRERRAFYQTEAHLQHFLPEMAASQHARGLWRLAASAFATTPKNAAVTMFLR